MSDARVPYVYPPEGESEIADEIRTRRKGGQLTELDGVLLNAPKIAEGYNAFLRSIRTSNSLPADVRELMILRVAVLNNAVYEWEQHEPVARKAGLTTEQLQKIRSIARHSQFPPSTSYIDKEGGLSPLQMAAISFTDTITLDVKVSQDVFNTLRSSLLVDESQRDQQMMEATATVAAYNTVSRILVALNVAGKNDGEVPYPA